MVRSILFRLGIAGNGIVNFDSTDQKFIYNGEAKSNKKTRFDNVSYGKKSFSRDEDGNLIDKIKISSNSIKHQLFSDDLVAHNPNVMHNSALFMNYIASPAAIVRGYLFTVRDRSSYKKKSPLIMTDAIQSCNAISTLEVCTRSGEKKMEDSETSDTTLFYKESVGEIKYKSTGIIDLKELQFVSCDQTMDRYSFNPDHFEIYKKFLSSRMDGVEDLELGYYKLVNSIVNLSEQGFLLSKEQLNFIVKMILKKLLALHITRRGAFAMTESLQIKFVTNPLVDTFTSQDNWVDITSEESIDAIDFEPMFFYGKVSDEEENALRNEIKEMESKLSKSKKDKSKEKKEAE